MGSGRYRKIPPDIKELRKRKSQCALSVLYPACFTLEGIPPMETHSHSLFEQTWGELQAPQSSLPFEPCLHHLGTCWHLTRFIHEVPQLPWGSQVLQEHVPHVLLKMAWKFAQPLEAAPSWLSIALVPGKEQEKQQKTGKASSKGWRMEKGMSSWPALAWLGRIMALSVPQWMWLDGPTHCQEHFHHQSVMGSSHRPSFSKTNPKERAKRHSLPSLSGWLWQGGSSE